MVLEYSQFLHVFHFEVVINIPKEGFKAFFKSYKVVSHGKEGCLGSEDSFPFVTTPKRILAGTAFGQVLNS